MHFYCITRGIKHDVDRLITELQGKYLPIDIKKENQKENYMVQLAVRPVQLWELVFPEPQLQTILNTLNPSTRSRMPLKVIRKALGVDKCPKPDNKTTKLPVYKSNVEIYPIGIKKDLFLKDESGYYERL